MVMKKTFVTLVLAVVAMAAQAKPIASPNEHVTVETKGKTLVVSYNLQNRPEFHRRLLNASWRYHWADAPSRTTYRVDLIDINYIYMPWLSETFKREYLDNANRNNAILRYNYSDLFILKLGFSMARTTPNAAFKMNLETAGNLLQGLNAFMHFRENSQGRHTLFNIAYAQYAKADFDFTYALRFSSNNELALHVGFGIAYPYGNSNALPFEKRYFALILSADGVSELSDLVHSQGAMGLLILSTKRVT